MTTLALTLVLVAARSGHLETGTTAENGGDLAQVARPIPFRGKRNEPAYVAHTAKVLAETIGISETEIAAATTDNFFRLFRKMPDVRSA